MTPPLRESEEEALRATDIDRPLRVVAVAVLIGEMIYTMPAPARHHHVVHELARLGVMLGNAEQGFLLSDGRFCQRKPAKIIAEKAGQLLVRKSGLAALFSEDVW